MVAGVQRSLEEGKVYSLSDLSCRFGLRGEALERVLDHLMEQGCLKPTVFKHASAHESSGFESYTRKSHVRLASSFDHQLAWMAQ